MLMVSGRGSGGRDIHRTSKGACMKKHGDSNTIVSAACGLALALATLPAWAVGTLIPAAQRTDMAHDGARGVVYVANGGEVLRYHLGSGGFLAPIVLGGSLRGLDLSLDQGTLAVADDVSSATEAWVHLVSLDDLSVRKASIAKTSTYEGGTHSVAFGGDGKLYASSAFWGSGWVPMRRFDTVSNGWTTLATVMQDTMLSPSGDGRKIAFAESNNSSGPWGLVDIPSGQIVRRDGYVNGTAWYNYEIAANRDGSQFAIPTYGGTQIYDTTYQKIATIGQYAGPQPIAAAYHPVEPIAYFPWSQTGEVRAYSMNGFTQTEAYDFEDTFSSTGNHAYQQGRTKLSRDGSLLMVSVNGGVRALQLYAPLDAAPVSASAIAGVPVSITLAGSIGNGGALNYAVAAQPSHGTLALSGASATYTPAADFTGTDSFRYAVRYGQAVREAVVTVAVTRPNTNPVATNDQARTKRTAILIPVLVNDSDADGDPLSIITVTQPVRGVTRIEGDKIRFTPPASWSGSVSFDYTISDGRGGTAQARVTVYRQ
ncbi:MAG: tandem-95 repeat protein [Lysobacteraceae bacterium]|nr:MAG: tandem-95 repeat protein [Xanthomonadaceae bacterium]